MWNRHGAVGVLVCYWYVTNYHKFSSLTNIHLSPQGVRSLVTDYLGPLLRGWQDCSQAVGWAEFFSRNESLSQAPTVVGEIQSLVVVGLRSAVSCGLSVGAALSSWRPLAVSYHVALSPRTWQLSSSRLTKQSVSQEGPKYSFKSFYLIKLGPSWIISLFINSKSCDLWP